MGFVWLGIPSHSCRPIANLQLQLKLDYLGPQLSDDLLHLLRRILDVDPTSVLDALGAGSKLQGADCFIEA